MSANLPTVRATSGLALSEGPSILAEKPVRLSTSGSVRPGIMRVVRAHADKPGVREAYEAGVDAGKNWKLIEADVRRAARLDDDAPSPLTPHNPPYFIVRRGDFSLPTIADKIMELYGEDRGEGRQLYSLPVMFLIDSWLTVLPHEFAENSKSGKKHWSVYDADGIRRCMEPGSPVYDEKAKRYHRTMGGVPPKMREWNDGKCNTDLCEQFQTGKCKLSGRLFFSIPGVPGGNVWVPTTSIVGLDQMRSQLIVMLQALGRITNRHGEDPMFFLTKVQMEMNIMDWKKGERVPTKQWVPILQPAIDVTKFLPSATVYDPNAIASATTALEGPRTVDDDESQVGFVHDIPGEEEGDDDDTGAGEFIPRDAGPTIDELKVSIKAKLSNLRIPWLQFCEYVEAKQGDGWKDDRTRLSRVWDEVEPITAEGRDDFAIKVKEGAKF